jgi:NDP-sugar pyrophosphorylase family protein
LHVDGKPILERIINHAKKDGFFDFIISINYLGHLIQNYFGDGKKLGVNIEYLIEDTPLGTAGSLSLIEPLPDSPLIVTNGDILTDFSYRDLINFHQNNNAEITVATKKVAWQNPFGVLKTQGINITEYQEKPVNISQVILGVYAIEPKVLKSLKKFESIDMPSFIMRVKEDSMRTIIFPVHEEWADLGTPAQLNSANQSFQNIQEHR